MAARRPRLSSEETKTRLIDAGITALHTSGLSIGLDAVNLEQAVRDADVSRSSAYAVWSTDGYSPQEDFQRAVLLRAIEDRRITLEALTDSIASHYGELVGTMSNQEILREIIRRTATSNVRATSESPSWRLVIALRAILHSVPEGERDQELADWIQSTSRKIRDYTIESVYKPLGEAVGLTPRPQYGDRAFELGEMCASAVSEGFSMRYWLDPADFLDGLPHPDSEDGEANWGMYGLVFEQIVRMFFVPESGSWD